MFPKLSCQGYHISEGTISYIHIETKHFSGPNMALTNLLEANGTGICNGCMVTAGHNEAYQVTPGNN